MKKKSKNSVKPSVVSRKVVRKMKREEKKMKRRQNFAAKKNILIEDISSKRRCVDKPGNLNDKKENVIDQQMKQNLQESAKFRKLQREMNARRTKQLREDNRKEDKIIKSLEKKLKLDKRKKKTLPQSFVMEGLDYLLEICDRDNFDYATNLEKELNDVELQSDSLENSEIDSANEGGEDEDFENENKNEARLNSRKRKSENNSMSKKSRLTEESDHDGDDDYNNDDNDVDDEDNENEGELESKTNIQEEEFNDYDDMSDSEDKEPANSEYNVENSLKEDIYGRLRNSQGEIVQITKYVPPQLRVNKQSQQCDENSEKLKRLSKRMKGLLNRLTSTNVHSIATQLEEMYMSNSRNEVNYTITKLLTESLILATNCPMRMVIEHALLISVLHANIGTEVGAYVLQNLVEEFDNLIQKDDLPVQDKRLDNIIATLIQFYNFKIFHACLVYEILEKLAQRFLEKDIELILIILKNVGFNLRKDDTVKLKEFIFSVQKKANEKTLETTVDSGRVKFMLETLLAVKNNNRIKVQQTEAEYIEHLKKLSKTLLHNGKYVSELKITLEDLLNANTRGRWWIVGSAWSGDLKDRAVDQNKSLSMEAIYDRKILNLAKKHRMNTDIRKSIFCIIMTAEDYIDAFEKLNKLALKGRQCQEVIYVTMHCLLQEKDYNPYYSFIVEQFSSLNRKYQIAVQFCSWDKFKEMNSLTDRQISNLAKFLAYLIMNQKLSLSVLKVLQFTEMDKSMIKLIRQLLMMILLADNEQIIAEVFSKIAKSEKLFLLRESLQLFLHHFILKGVFQKASKAYVDETNFHLLPKRIEIADNIMRGGSEF